MLDLALVKAGDGNAEVRDAANKVSGAVDRVDYPLVFAVGIATLAGFLAEKAVVRVGLLQVVDDFLLGFAVDFRDEIVLALGLDFNAIQLLRGAGDQITGLARGAQGDIQHGLHRTKTLNVQAIRRAV